MKGLGALPFDPGMILDLFPNHDFSIDEKGQIIIHTGMYEDDDDENELQLRVWRGDEDLL